MIPGTTTRPGRDSDAAAVIALIERCWADYPGLALFVDEEEPELRALATHFERQHGALWIAEAPDGTPVGMAAARPCAPGWEICRVYVHPSRHGTGLAQHLVGVAEHWAATRGGAAPLRLHLWSDTRFTRAHRFYEKLGYTRTGGSAGERALGDRSNSHEYRFEKTRSP